MYVLDKNNKPATQCGENFSFDCFNRYMPSNYVINAVVLDHD
jgi:hypothetical protein